MLISDEMGEEDEEKEAGLQVMQAAIHHAYRPILV